MCPRDVKLKYTDSFGPSSNSIVKPVNVKYVCIGSHLITVSLYLYHVFCSEKLDSCVSTLDTDIHAKPPNPKPPAP